MGMQWPIKTVNNEMGERYRDWLSSDARNVDNISLLFGEEGKSQLRQVEDSTPLLFNYF